MTLREFMTSRWGVALSEPSTWRGMIMIAGSFGVYFTPDQSQSIVTAVLAAVGVLNTFLKDDPNSATLTKPKPVSDVIKETRE